MPKKDTQENDYIEDLATDCTNSHRLETTKGCFICINSKKKICEANL